MSLPVSVSTSISLLLYIIYFLSIVSIQSLIVMNIVPLPNNLLPSDVASYLTFLFVTKLPKICCFHIFLFIPLDSEICAPIYSLQDLFVTKKKGNCFHIDLLSLSVRRHCWSADHSLLNLFVFDFQSVFSVSLVGFFTLIPHPLGDCVPKNIVFWSLFLAHYLV